MLRKFLNFLREKCRNHGGFFSEEEKLHMDMVDRCR